MTATTTPSNASDLVPAEWPPVRTDTPSPVWTMRGIFALPGMIPLWFSPRRVGASLAGAGWVAAVTAHFLGLGLGIGMIIWAESFPWLNPFETHPARSLGFMETSYPPVEMSPGEYVRGPFVALALTAHSSTAAGGGLGRFILTFLGIEVGLLVVALAMMPFAAGGENAKRLFGRCLRLTSWSTTLLIPFGVVWLMVPSLREWTGHSSTCVVVDYSVLALFAMWWLLVLLRSGYRYAGPAEGPAWEVRTPRCEACGYNIAHLTQSTRCPECGRPVTESFVGRRRPPPFATAGSYAASCRALWSTMRARIADKSFFDRLAVHCGYERARIFFLVNLFLVALMLFLIVPAIELIAGGHSFSGNAWGDAVVISSAWVIAGWFFAGIFSVIIAAAGHRELRPTAVTTFYALGIMRPLAISFIALALGFVSIMAVVNWITSVPVATVIVGLVILACSGGCGLAWDALRNIGGAFRQTRFANG